MESAPGQRPPTSTEAAKAALAFGFEDAGLVEIVSFTNAGNHRSQRVMERIGLTRDPAGDFDHPAVPPGTRSAGMSCIASAMLRAGKP
jgi:RimJ/RimL family protein N-acetyltransferase